VIKSDSVPNLDRGSGHVSGQWLRRGHRWRCWSGQRRSDGADMGQTSDTRMKEENARWSLCAISSRHSLACGMMKGPTKGATTLRRSLQIRGGVRAGRGLAFAQLSSSGSQVPVRKVSSLGSLSEACVCYSETLVNGLCANNLPNPLSERSTCIISPGTRFSRFANEVALQPSRSNAIAYIGRVLARDEVVVIPFIETEG
jgi:hypothetical protein